MTAYAVGFMSTASGPASAPIYAASAMVAIRAGDFPVRLIQIQANGLLTTGTETGTVVRRYETSAISGGVLLTPASLREGAEPVSATVRHQTCTWDTTPSSPSWTAGSAVTVTGTARQMGTTPAQSSSGWSPPTEIVVAPGSTLHLKPNNELAGTGVNASYLHFTIWFDEERTPRSN